jgi:hypothetical protein
VGCLFSFYFRNSPSVHTGVLYSKIGYLQNGANNIKKGFSYNLVSFEARRTNCNKSVNTLRIKKYVLTFATISGLDGCDLFDGING